MIEKVAGCGTKYDGSIDSLISWINESAEKLFHEGAEAIVLSAINTPGSLEGEPGEGRGRPYIYLDGYKGLEKGVPIKKQMASERCRKAKLNWEGTVEDCRKKFDRQIFGTLENP